MFKTAVLCVLFRNVNSTIVLHRVSAASNFQTDKKTAFCIEETSSSLPYQYLSLLFNIKSIKSWCKLLLKRVSWNKSENANTAQKLCNSKTDISLWKNKLSCAQIQTWHENWHVLKLGACHRLILFRLQLIGIYLKLLWNLIINNVCTKCY